MRKLDILEIIEYELLHRVIRVELTQSRDGVIDKTDLFLDVRPGVVFHEQVEDVLGDLNDVSLVLGDTGVLEGGLASEEFGVADEVAVLDVRDLFADFDLEAFVDEHFGAAGGLLFFFFEKSLFFLSSD